MHWSVWLLALCEYVSAQCNALPPQGSPQANFDAINNCLKTGKAMLTAGTFPVPQGIAVPPNAVLGGNSSSPATIVISAPTGVNYVVSLGDNSTVSFLTFDAANHLPAGCCSAIFSVGNINNAFVHDCGGTGQHDPPGTGIYFFSATSTKNTFLRVSIWKNHYGAIFVAGLPAGSANRIQDSMIHDNYCDAVTFAGYGELVGTKIYYNGWDCRNGSPPIPGGGPYCLDNHVGGLIQGNTVSDNCGMVLDIDTCSNFVVTGNTFFNPGNTWNGQFPYCEGAPSVSLIDCTSFLFQSNTVANGRDSNAVGRSPWGDPNGVFSDVGRPAFEDLPNGGNTVLGLIITHRPPTEANNPSINTQVIDNAFQADCGYAGCAGVGYFAGRGSGWAPSAWLPNLYTGNNPFGSNIGSRRCGGNWYAGATPSCPAGAPPPCNQDDFQHPDTGNWRNDPGCGPYSVSANSTPIARFNMRTQGQLNFTLPRK